MRKLSWSKFIRSGVGRTLAGAFLGALLVAFSGIESPVAFLVGMLAGAVVLYILGRWE
jgi:hypothetical protein